MDEWQRFTGTKSIPGSLFYKIDIVTPDNGGKVGKAIFDNLVRINDSASGDNVFAVAELVLNDENLGRGVGGTHGIGTMTSMQGKPIISTPKSEESMTYHRQKDSSDPLKKTILLKLGLYNAVILLHETNHAVHRFVNHGKYLQPNSKMLLKFIDQDTARGIMSRTMSTGNDMTAKRNYKKANEMETYWLCCCDAVKYGFSEEAIRAIKAVNNQNLVNAGYETLPGNILEKLYSDGGRPNDSKEWEKLYDINTLDPTKPGKYQYGNDESPDAGSPAL